MNLARQARTRTGIALAVRRWARRRCATAGSYIDTITARTRDGIPVRIIITLTIDPEQDPQR